MGCMLLVPKDLRPTMAQLFAVGVHFVVILAVAHTVLLREQLLQKYDCMIRRPLATDSDTSVAL